MLDWKEDVNPTDGKKRTPLHIACRNGCLALVELLLRNGADLEAAGETGDTPLHEATAFGREQIVEVLL